MERITFGNALLISLFSILFVFVLLYLISLVISFISVVCKKNSKTASGQRAANIGKSQSSDEEIVAVITAAISMYNDGREVNIKSIKDNSTGLWLKNARLENIK